MGPGDHDELSLSDAELAADELATRRLLARWGEPAAAPPPPALNARVLAALAGRPPRRAARRARPLLGALALAIVAPLLLLGIWGVLGDSLGPASLAGDPAGGLGRLLLGLTLAAKPLVNLLLGAGAYGLAAFALLLAGAWLWWRLVRVAPSRLEAPL